MDVNGGGQRRALRLDPHDAVSCSLRPAAATDATSILRRKTRQVRCTRGSETGRRRRPRTRIGRRARGTFDDNGPPGRQLAAATRPTVCAAAAATATLAQANEALGGSRPRWRRREEPGSRRACSASIRRLKKMFTLNGDNGLERSHVELAACGRRRVRRRRALSRLPSSRCRSVGRHAQRLRCMARQYLAPPAAVLEGSIAEQATPPRPTSMSLAAGTLGLGRGAQGLGSSDMVGVHARAVDIHRLLLDELESGANLLRSRTLGLDRSPLVALASRRIGPQRSTSWRAACALEGEARRAFYSVSARALVRHRRATFTGAAGHSRPPPGPKSLSCRVSAVGSPATHDRRRPRRRAR